MNVAARLRWLLGLASPTGVRVVGVAEPRPEETGTRLTLTNVQRGPEGGPYACPCCHSITLPERGAFELCPVCFWEDDGQDDHDADEVRGGPNGTLSLTQARANFAAVRASDRAFIDSVRPPRPHERPER